MVVVAHPDIGDGFAKRAGKKILVVHPLEDPDEIIRRAFASGIVCQDPTDHNHLHFHLVYDINPDQFRYFPCNTLPITFRVKKEFRLINQNHT